jgi:hypothetical protein
MSTTFNEAVIMNSTPPLPGMCPWVAETLSAQPTR